MPNDVFEGLVTAVPSGTTNKTDEASVLIP